MRGPARCRLQRAKANEMPIGCLIGFEAQDSARFPLLMGEC